MQTRQGGGGGGQAPSGHPLNPLPAAQVTEKCHAKQVHVCAAPRFGKRAVSQFPAPSATTCRPRPLLGPRPPKPSLTLQKQLQRHRTSAHHEATLHPRASCLPLLPPSFPLLRPILLLPFARTNESLSLTGLRRLAFSTWISRSQFLAWWANNAPTYMMYKVRRVWGGAGVINSTAAHSPACRVCKTLGRGECPGRPAPHPFLRRPSPSPPPPRPPAPLTMPVTAGQALWVTGRMPSAAQSSASLCPPSSPHTPCPPPATAGQAPWVTGTMPSTAHSPNLMRPLPYFTSLCPPPPTPPHPPTPPFSPLTMPATAG